LDELRHHQVRVTQGAGFVVPHGKLQSTVTCAALRIARRTALHLAERPQERSSSTIDSTRSTIHSTQNRKRIA